MSIALFDGLRVEVERALRRRRCWLLPPAYLGYGEYLSWSQPGATQDLASDILLAAFVPKVTQLAARIEANAPPRALLRQVLKRHLSDVHRSFDPIGYRVYRTLTQVFEAPGWHVVDTVPRTPSEVVELVCAHEAWSEYGPKLGQSSPQGVTWLRGLLESIRYEWSEAGAAPLVQALKAPVKKALFRAPVHEHAIATEEDDEGDERFILAVHAVEPSCLPSVATAMKQGLEGERLSRERRDLALRVIDEMVRRATTGDEVPTQAEVAAALGLKRTAMSDYFALLRRVASRLIAEGRL